MGWYWGAREEMSHSKRIKKGYPKERKGRYPLLTFGCSEKSKWDQTKVPKTGKKRGKRYTSGKDQELGGGEG